MVLLGLWERAVHKRREQWTSLTPVGPGSPEWQRWGGIWRVGRRTSSNSGTENTAGRSDWGGGGEGAMQTVPLKTLLQHYVTAPNLRRRKLQLVRKYNTQHETSSLSQISQRKLLPMVMNSPVSCLARPGLCCAPTGLSLRLQKFTTKTNTFSLSVSSGAI